VCPRAGVQTVEKRIIFSPAENRTRLPPFSLVTTLTDAVLLLVPYVAQGPAEITIAIRQHKETSKFVSSNIHHLFSVTLTRLKHGQNAELAGP
jgi:hypothetical protein